MTDTPYGYCPKCGAPGRTRERRPNGNDLCENGHLYPSRQARNHLPTMTDISDKAVQEALENIRATIVSHEIAREGGGLDDLEKVKARIEADARAIRAASVIAHKRRPHWKDWDDLDAALAAREQVK